MSLRLKSRLFRTASFRFAAAYVALFAASTMILGGTVFWIASGALNAELRARIEAEHAERVSEFRAGGMARLIAAIRRGERGVHALDERVQAADGTRLAGTLPSIPPRAGWIDLTADDSEAGGATVQHGARPELVRALVSPLPGGAWLAVGDDLGRVREAQATILGAVVWALALGVVLGVAGGVALSRAFLRRVDAIGRTAEAIIAGDLTRRVPLRGTGDDLDRLAGTLNRMLERIAALMESLRQVSADVAHDLRTPLTRLTQTLETARHEATSPAQFRAALAAAGAETASILETFDALLRIAEVEAGARRAGFRPLDLSALAASVAEAYAPAIEATGRRFETPIAPGIGLRGDRELLAQALANLLDNALRHAPEGRRIALGLRREGAGLVLWVDDNGPGVPEAERGRIFARFYRAERSRTSPGNGLGLAMVAAVAELHGGRAVAEDAGPGLRVEMRLPGG